MTTVTVALYTLNPPVPWQAGRVGDKPFYFGCADCNPEGTNPPAQPIAGAIATDGLSALTFDDVQVFELERGLLKSAMFCEPCTARRLADRDLNQKGDVTQ